MNRETGGTISMVLGALLVRLVATGEHRRFVRPGLGPWLVIAAGVLLALGLATLIRAWRTGHPEVDDVGPADHDSNHDHGTERIAWLLVTPVLILLLVAPPALGSYAVDRSSRVDVTSGPAVFATLEVGPVHDISVLEFMQRSAEHDGASMANALVRLTGFVAGQEGNDQFRLARYSIACCAADAAAAVAMVEGVSEAPPSDTWVRVIGTYDRLAGEIPVLTATSIETIPAPDDPYET